MSEPKSKLSRRKLFAGAGTVGGIVAAATVLPQVMQQAAPAVPQTKEPPEKGGGYQLTDHVKRYYESTLV